MGSNDHLHTNEMTNVPERKMGPGYRYEDRTYRNAKGEVTATDADIASIPPFRERSPRAETPKASNGSKAGGGSSAAPRKCIDCHNPVLDGNFDLCPGCEAGFHGMEEASTSKPSNPKDIIGSDKLPMDLVTGTTKAYLALAHLEGHLKYGLVNWRAAGVRASIYLGALERHYEKFKDGGEWADPVTKVPHLASIMACCSIILDAQLAGKLNDDRPKSNAALPQLIDDLGANVKHLKELFKDKNPRHYTIADNEDNTR